MNPLRLRDFESYLEQAIQPITASPARKRIMREEMLAHLLNSYEEELARLTDEKSAGDVAIKRLGNADELRLQLQDSVPFFERALFLCLGRKETVMLPCLWIVGLVAWIIGMQSSFALHEQLEFGGLALFCGCTFWHLCQKDNIALRLIGPRGLWLAGLIAVLFGTAVVLPAMAKIKQQGGFAALSTEALTLGVLITLGGLGLVAYGIKKPRAGVS